MKILDLFQETYFAITANKARSTLTILGIVIGIASVIALLGVGQGAQQSIQENIEAGGANLLMVYPGSSRSGGFSFGRGTAKTLTLNDAQAIRDQVDNIQAVASQVSSNYQIVADGNNTNAGIMGVDSEYPVVKDLTIKYGTFFTQQQSDILAKVAVLGPTIVSDLYPDVDARTVIGQKVRINKINFTIIGVTKATGGVMNSTDNSVLVPLVTAQRYFTGDKYLQMINVKAIDQQSMQQVENDLKSVMLQQHGIADELLADFSVRNMEDMVEMASSVTGTLTALLGAIAGISLVVGGIGIMNMMLTTVTERTKEIGLKKAIGAKNRDISTQFLMESTLLTLIGGVIGIVAGWLIIYLLEKFLDYASSITWYSIVLAVGVSAFIGIVFGYYPARRASKLNPIEALRYE